MRVLFDNNVPAPLRRHLVGHQVDTAKEMGWQELKNGDLLTAAEQDGFQVMVTGDKNLAYQQNLEGRTLALVVLPTIDWSVLKRAAATLVLRRRWIGRSREVSKLCLKLCLMTHRPAVRLVDHPAQSSNPPQTVCRNGSMPPAGIQATMMGFPVIPAQLRKSTSQEGRRVGSGRVAGRQYPRNGPFPLNIG